MKNNRITFVAKEFALPLSVFFLIFFACFFVLVPKARQISELKKKVDNQEKIVDQLSQKIADLKTLSESELFDSYSILLDALPGEKDFYNSVMMSKKVLGKNDVGLSSFKLSSGGDKKEDKKTPQGPQQMTVDVSFSSSFESLKRMFTEVNNMLPLTDIESIKFGEIMEATESGSFFDMNGKMNLVSYWAPLPVTLDKPEKPLPKISSEDKKLIEQLKNYLRIQETVEVESFSEITVGKDNPF